jgi:hypothetical protein
MHVAAMVSSLALLRCINKKDTVGTSRYHREDFIQPAIFGNQKVSE